MVDVDVMRAIAADLFVGDVEKLYGAAGSAALRQLLVGVHVAHRHLAFELIKDGVTLFAQLDPSNTQLPLEGGVEIAPVDLPARVQQAAILQVMPNGRLRFWPRSVENFVELAEVAVVYHYREGDFFFLDGSLVQVPNPLGFPSVFAIPTFVDLDRALEYYATALARYSTCRILQTCWHDRPRLILTNKPESIMRESLAQFLRSTLRSHELVEVREEQNVDESHPVDIKITWSQSNRIAIMEVKWLGYSVNNEGTRLSTVYREPRALEGALQLADYLEANVQRAPRHITRGYLVVFDVRRRGIRGDQVEQDVSREDAIYYANAEIEYDPRFDLIRMDFAQPVRFYLAPRDLNIAS
jgi:hypothetical protein